MILVDTNVLSETARPSPDARVLAWLKSETDQLRLPAIALAELHYGIAKLPQSRKRSELEAWLERIERQFARRIVSFDKAAAKTHGELRARLRSLGKPVDAPDSYIAAIALARNLPVATRNRAHFELSGVELIDPWLG